MGALSRELDSYKMEKITHVKIWLVTIDTLPDPPKNIEFKVLVDSMLLDQQVNYKLVQMAFGPMYSLVLNLSVYIPVSKRKPPVIISMTAG